MNEAKLRTIAQLQDFLNATPEVSFSGIGEKGDNERYAHISRVLKRFDYPHRKKNERGVVLAYLQRTSGYSRAQIKRLVARWHENRLAEVPLRKRYRAPAAPFARKYTASDIDLLVEMDRANEDVCGPAIVHLFKRAYNTYGDKRYERLVNLSVSHLYNLRKWAAKSNQKESVSLLPAQLPTDLPAQSWSPAQRLLALNQTHTLSGEDLHAWCRERGLFEHQLNAWREAFCSATPVDSKEAKSALRELQGKHEVLQRELRRKEKALAEAAALLVLQKKFQALWEDEEK